MTRCRKVGSSVWLADDRYSYRLYVMGHQNPSNLKTNCSHQVVALATGWISQEHPGLVVARRRKLLKVADSESAQQLSCRRVMRWSSGCVHSARPQHCDSIPPLQPVNFVPAASRTRGHTEKWFPTSTAFVSTFQQIGVFRGSA